MTNPSPGSCLGGRGRRGAAMVPTGAALTTTRRRTPAACIAPAIARVPVEAIPYSAFDRGPSADSTASAPPTAVARAAGCAVARSALTARTSAGSAAGFRTTAVTSCPAAMAGPTRWRPMPPRAAKNVSFICLAVPLALGRARRLAADGHQVVATKDVPPWTGSCPAFHEYRQPVPGTVSSVSHMVREAYHMASILGDADVACPTAGLRYR